MFIGAACAASVAFAADAYLQSTVNSINTGYCVRPTTAIVFDFEADEVCPNARFFGSRKTVWFSYYTGGLAAGQTDVTTLKEGWCFRDGSGNYTSTSLTTHDYLGVRRVVTIDGYGNKVKVERKDNGQTLYSSDITFAHNTSEIMPLYLFDLSVNPNQVGGYNSKFKLYSCKLYEAGELVRDFIPAVKNGIAGLYDRVTGVFLIDQNGRPFNYGGDITELTEDAPYVETTGDQAFDTGYLTNPDTRLECDFAWAELIHNKRAFGAVNNAGNAPYVDLCCLTNAPDMYYDAWSWGDLRGNWTRMTPRQYAGFRHTVVMDSYHSKLAILYGGATNYTANMTTQHAVTNNVTLYIGASHEVGDGAINLSRVRIYGFRIYEKDVLVHDFRPVLRSGRPGLKDELTGVWLDSAIGSPVLSGGGIQEDGNYLESTGVQTLTTDWCPTPDTCFVADFTSIENVPNSREFTCRRTSDSDIGLFVDYCSNGTTDSTDSGYSDEFWSCKDDGGNYSRVGSGDKIIKTANLLGINRRLVFDSFNGKVQMLRGMQSIASTTMTTTRTKTCSRPISVFGRRPDPLTGNADMGSKMRLYSLKIYERGGLVRDYIPYVTEEGAGLKDTLSGVFCRAMGESNLTVGASVPYSAKACDAYVQATSESGATGVSTGYRLTPKTRVECDFAYDVNVANGRFFGCRGDIWFSAYNDGTLSSVGWNLGDAANWKSFHARNLMRGARQIVVLDRKNGFVSMASAGKKIHETKNFDSVRTKTGTDPLMIFSNGNGSGVSHQPHPMRLYRFKIYEDDELVHDYVPKADGEAICLYDLKGKGSLALPSDKGYSISGLGYDTVAFIETPQDAFVQYGAEPATLRCFAPGAVSYNWYCNGEELDETGPELSVYWKKTRTDDVISVKAVGMLNGKAIESEPVQCTVGYQKLGFGIFLR